MNDTGNSFGSNPASLKGKLQTLEVVYLLWSNKSKTSPTNSTTTKKKSRFLEAKKIRYNLCLLWRLQMSKKVCPMSSSALKKKCKMKLILGKGISISKKLKIAESSNRSLLSRGKKQHCSSNFSGSSAESQSLRCR